MTNFVRYETSIEALELVINQDNGDVYASQSATGRMCDTAESNIRYICTSQQWGLLAAEILTPSGVRSSQLLNEDQIFDCLAKYNPPLLAQCAKAGLRVYLYGLAGYEIKPTSKTLEDDRLHLEKTIAPKPKLSEIKQATKMYEARYGKAYGDRYHDQMMAKHYPALMGSTPEPAEKASLVTAKALLTPTKIAEKLGVLHKTGSGNGSKINSMLVELGYQESIGGRWSATDKAINANLVDRKPVDTNSRSQKDQLLWSADVIAILQEHLTTGGASA
jgi:hypothetical protein